MYVGITKSSQLGLQQPPSSDDLRIRQLFNIICKGSELKETPYWSSTYLIKKIYQLLKYRYFLTNKFITCDNKNKIASLKIEVLSLYDNTYAHL